MPPVAAPAAAPTAVAASRPAAAGANLARFLCREQVAKSRVGRRSGPSWCHAWTSAGSCEGPAYRSVGLLGATGGKTQAIESEFTNLLVHATGSALVVESRTAAGDLTSLRLFVSFQVTILKVLAGHPSGPFPGGVKAGRGHSDFQRNGVDRLNQAAGRPRSRSLYFQPVAGFTGSRGLANHGRRSGIADVY